MIEYLLSNGNMKVRLDGKIVGSIHAFNGGFQYFPKGSKTGGELFPSLEACKRSLEADK
jgi:hypothetical protein